MSAPPPSDPELQSLTNSSSLTPPPSKPQLPSSTSWRSLTFRQKLRVSGVICGGVLFLSGLIAIGLSLRYEGTRLPSIYLEQFDVIAPNQTTISNSATGSIRYKFWFYTYVLDKEEDIGTYYYGVNITFYYRSPNNLTFVPMAGAHFDPFYDSPLRSTGTYLRGQAQTSGVVWGSSLAEMYFKVELKTKVNQWGTKKIEVHVGAQVQVNDEGTLTKKNRHKMLYSAGGKIKSSSFRHWVLLVVLIAIYL